jgi:hypothetical protein
MARVSVPFTGRRLGCDCQFDPQSPAASASNRAPKPDARLWKCSRKLTPSLLASDAYHTGHEVLSSVLNLKVLSIPPIEPWNSCRES